MNNPIPPSSVSGASFHSPLKPTQFSNSIKHVLNDLGLDITKVVINTGVLNQSYQKEELRKKLKTRLEDIKDSRSTFCPDPELLKLLGIDEDPKNLVCYVSSKHVTITFPFESK